MISRIIETTDCEPWIWLWWPHPVPRTDYLHTCHLFPSHTQRKYGSEELGCWGCSVHVRWRWDPNPDWFHIKAPMLNSCIFLPSGKLARGFENKEIFLTWAFWRQNFVHCPEALYPQFHSQAALSVATGVKGWCRNLLSRVATSWNFISVVIGRDTEKNSHFWVPTLCQVVTLLSTSYVWSYLLFITTP